MTKTDLLGKAAISVCALFLVCLPVLVVYSTVLLLMVVVCLWR